MNDFNQQQIAQNQQYQQEMARRQQMSAMLSKYGQQANNGTVAGGVGSALAQGLNGYLQGMASQKQNDPLGALIRQNNNWNE